MTKLVEKFGVAFAKLMSTPLAQHFKLSMRDSPDTDEEKELMKKIPYVNALGCLMYLIVCTSPDLGHSASIVSSCMSNPEKCVGKLLNRC